jgi:regulator of replication initiation timing
VTTQELFDNVYKLVKLLKPEFQNRLTWLVVLAGLTILSSGLIERIINAIFKISFNIDITNGNNTIVGVGLVVTGLSYNIFSRKLSLKTGSKSNNETDAELHARELESENSNLKAENDKLKKQIEEIHKIVLDKQEELILVAVAKNSGADISMIAGYSNLTETEAFHASNSLLSKTLIILAPIGLGPHPNSKEKKLKPSGAWIVTPKGHAYLNAHGLLSA